MTFLQPFLLWGLPLVLLPLIIHFFNRMRYKSMSWVGMDFLLRASRQSARRARLRHLLILLCRMLAVAALVFALARPLVGCCESRRLPRRRCSINPAKCYRPRKRPP